MPLPIELLITVVGTTLFQITNIAENYNMIQVRTILFISFGALSVDKWKDLTRCGIL